MSNKKCCVPECKNSSGSKDTLHKFPHPTKDRELFNTWVYSVGGHILGLENDHIYKYRRVCHIHFEEQYWCQNNRLSNIAVPTKHLPGLSSKKFHQDETSILRSIENTMVVPEASTSKASTSRAGELIDSQPAIADMKVKENLEADSVCINPASEILKRSSRDTSKMVKKERSQPVVVRKKLQKRVPVTQAEQALYRRLVQVGVKLSKCRSVVKRQSAKLKAMKKITSNPYFLNTLENLPSRAKMLMLMQFREIKKKNKGRRFTLQEKIVALTIMKQSPKGYRFLRKIFVLPSPQTLTKLISMADIRPGINKNTIDQLKKSAEKMKPEDRLCVVLFDEMSLKPSLAFNDRRDKVSGFTTNGTKTQAEFADHAQVFMVRGVTKKYKQAVAYTFSQAATKGPELAQQLKTVISEIQAAGLIVVATICDQGTNNTKCYKLLLQETRGILLRRGEEPRDNVILINDQQIVPLYDPPHMMKCIRNNLITKDLRYKKDGLVKFAKWDHITRLHEENPGYKGIRLVPKLTDFHCIPSKIPKMKVKYATQLFSQTVASNMGYLAGAYNV